MIDRSERIRIAIKKADLSYADLERITGVSNYEYQKSAFYYELGNHEYHINTYQGDWDTLSTFGNIEWHGQGREAREAYYKELNFTPTQIKAYEDARREYMKKADEEDWY